MVWVVRYRLWDEAVFDEIWIINSWLVRKRSRRRDAKRLTNGLDHVIVVYLGFTVGSEEREE